MIASGVPDQTAVQNIMAALMETVPVAMPPRKPPALPAFLGPQLATLVDDVPTGKAWIYEIKYDGYRTLVAADGPSVRCYSRTGWTGRTATPAPRPRSPRCSCAARSSTARWQSSMPTFAPASPACRTRCHAAARTFAYCAFDLLFHDGEDLRRRPLIERKARLADLLDGAATSLIYSAHLETGGAKLHISLCRRGCEDIVAKRGDKPYLSGRSQDWLKIKCVQEQEFVVAGFTRSDARLPFASLILALHDKSGLRYAGHVGTGFTDAERTRLRAMLRPLERPTPPAEGVLPAEVRRKATWIEPRLVVQVAFTELTAMAWCGTQLPRHPGGQAGARGARSCRREAESGHPVATPARLKDNAPKILEGKHARQAHDRVVIHDQDHRRHHYSPPPAKPQMTGHSDPAPSAQ